MALNPGYPPLDDRLTVAEPARSGVKPDPSRLLSLVQLALRLAREDLAAAAAAAEHDAGR